MLVLLFGACIATPWIATHDPIKQNYRERLQPPSEKHLLGTDRMGRDIYSRLLWGGRRLVTIAILAVALRPQRSASPTACSPAISAARSTPWPCASSTGFWPFPGLLLYLLIVTLAREWKLEGIYNDIVLVFALGFAFMPEVARLSRGSVLAEKQKEYVEASRAIGEGSLGHRAAPDPAQHRLAADRQRHGAAGLRHPDRGGAVVPRAGHAAADARLGLRPQPPRATTWKPHPLIAAFPGLAICYTVLAFNLFGDGLRDILDPRLAER